MISTFYHNMNTQNSFNKTIECKVCNNFYTKRYMPKHKQTLKHIENTYELDMEEDIEQQIINYNANIYIEKNI